MQYLCLFKPNPDAPNDPGHRAAMGAYMDESFRSGELVATSGLGMRKTVGYRMEIENGELTVMPNPKGKSVLMEAAGFAVLDARNPDDLLRQIRRFLDINHGGSVEVLGLAMPLMTGPGMPPAMRSVQAGVIPYLNLDGADEASKFYQKAFGAKELARMPGPDGKKVMHCHLEINGGSLMIADNFPEMGFPPVTRSDSVILHLVVDEGDMWWSRAISAGCRQTLPFEVAPWGDRYGQFVDPWDVKWALVEPAGSAPKP